MFTRVLQFAALLLCCSSLLCEAMLKRKRDLGLLSMLQGIENYLDEDIAPATVNKNDITHMIHKYFGSRLKIVAALLEFAPI